MNLRYTQNYELLSSASRTSSGVSNAINVSEYTEGLIFLNVSAVDTEGTLDVKLQYSIDGTNWKDSDYVFSTVEGLPSTFLPKALPIENFGRYIRVAYTITDGDYTFEVKFIGKS